MISEKEVLALDLTKEDDRKKLGEIAGELLLSKSSHLLYPSMELQHEMCKSGTRTFCGSWECTKCGKWFDIKSEKDVDITGWPKVTYRNDCHPYLPITPNSAFEWRMKMVKSDYWEDAKMEVYKSWTIGNVSEDTPNVNHALRDAFFANHAQPIHFISVAVVCKIKEASNE